LKKVVAISLLFAFLIQCQMNTVILTVFYLERNYISKTFCENKSKPELKCHGKCYLKKQLDKEEKSKSGLPLLSKIKAEQLFVSELTDLDNNCNADSVKHFTIYLTRPYSKFLFSLFHPPPFFNNDYVIFNKGNIYQIINNKT